MICDWSLGAASMGNPFFSLLIVRENPRFLTSLLPLVVRTRITVLEPTVGSSSVIINYKRLFFEHLRKMHSKTKAPRSWSRYRKPAASAPELGSEENVQVKDG